MLLGWQVLGGAGELKAYIEADGTVGGADLSYLGEVTDANANGVGYVTYDTSPAVRYCPLLSVTVAGT